MDYSKGLYFFFELFQSTQFAAALHFFSSEQVAGQADHLGSADHPEH
ncbi:hypothetical protein Aconfl_40160 [Algoriphagus confluentis]|uniref:Uncharacterized protein n=1 Tax=Algoriphagus confluentis TaxID=1697556 RepID=A0ABQ6PXC6_9BACT|nr:hypothetical protein Aconfl_40160 [Algoriphagus confluentis]